MLVARSDGVLAGDVRPLPGAVELLIAYGRMPHWPARAKLVAFVESLAE